MAELVLVDTHAGVLTATLNRPNKMNAFTRPLLAELAEVVKTAERDDAVKALVLTGAGRAFSAGQDLAEFDVSADAGTVPVGDLLRTRVNPLLLRLRGLEKPVLAAVNGVAAGAGMGLALACDLRYAAESARFIQAFVNVGLVPDAGSSYFLVRLVGQAKALELAWTGDAVSAKDALEMGMVEKVVPDGEALAATRALAERLAKGPSKALGLMKRHFNQAHEMPLERVLEMEAGYQDVAARTADFREGVSAFLEKRRPRFTGA